MAAHDKSMGGKWRNLHLDAQEAQLHLNDGDPEGAELISRRNEVIASLDAIAKKQFIGDRVTLYGIHKKTKPHIIGGDSGVNDSGDGSTIATSSEHGIPIESTLFDGKTTGASHGFSILDTHEMASAVESEHQGLLLEELQRLSPGRYAVAYLVKPDDVSSIQINTPDFSMITDVDFFAVAPVYANYQLVEKKPEVIDAVSRNEEVERILMCWPSRYIRLRQLVEDELSRTSDALRTLAATSVKIDEILANLSPPDCSAFIDRLEVRYTDKLFDKPYLFRDGLPASLFLGDQRGWTQFNPGSHYQAVFDGLVAIPKFQKNGEKPILLNGRELCARMKFETTDDEEVSLAVPLKDLAGHDFVKLRSNRTPNS